MEPRYTDEQVMTTLSEVVAERPDYVYAPPEEVPAHVHGETSLLADCFYVHEDGPGCLVGHVLHRLGMPLEALKKYENNGPADFYRDRVVSFRAAEVLGVAQMYQDEGSSWASALAAAESLYERD